MTSDAVTSDAGSGRLAVRLGASPDRPASPGATPLGLGSGRDGLLHVPATAGMPGTAGSPLVVALHGAGGTAAGMLRLVRDAAEEHGVLVLAPDSRGRTWDLIAERGFGSDVAFLERAMAVTGERCRLDPGRIAIGGFSDGASYALSLGITNGDLFGHVLAFSPGFAAPGEAVGRPAVFVSHGTADRVLPVQRCSRRIVPALRRAGHAVVYREFDGGHEVPPGIATAALGWFAAGGPP